MSSCVKIEIAGDVWIAGVGKKNGCERARASSFRFLSLQKYHTLSVYFLFQYVALVLVPVCFLFVFAFHFSILESIPQSREFKPEEKEDEGTIT